MNYYTYPGINGGAEIINDALYVQRLRSIVCNEFGVTEKQFMSKSRKRYLVDARFILCYIARKNTKLTTTELGKEIGGRNHATVLHGLKQAEYLEETSLDYRLKIYSIRDKIHRIVAKGGLGLTVGDLHKFTPMAKRDLIEAA